MTSFVLQNVVTVIMCIMTAIMQICSLVVSSSCSACSDISCIIDLLSELDCNCLSHIEKCMYILLQEKESMLLSAMACIDFIYSNTTISYSNLNIS